MEVTREEALRYITSKKIVEGEGIYRLKVTNVTPYRKERENGAVQVAIVNFNGKTSYHEQAAATLFGQGDYKEAANQGLSLSILEGQEVPTKGQIVDVVVEEVTTKNGITGLFAQSFTSAPVNHPKTRSADAFLAMAEGSDTVEEVSALSEHAAPFEKQSVRV